MILPPQNKPVIRNSKSGESLIKKETTKNNNLCEQYTIYINDPSLGNNLICTRYKNDKTR